MMIATNWGVFEIGMRPENTIPHGDTREMQIRARSEDHLDALRAHFPMLGDTITLNWGKMDFPYRAYISRTNLVLLLAGLESTVDYVQFKKDAVTPRLHGLLSRLWSAHLAAYPEGSVYSAKSWWKHSDK